MSNGHPLSSTVMIILSASDFMVMEMDMVFFESFSGQEVEGMPPCRTMLDISSSRQIWIANAWDSGRPSSDVIDWTQLAAARISKIVPVKTRCQRFRGGLRRDKRIQLPKTVSIFVEL